ncbi:MAG: T9SS type A sorting domain-containing protein, partial [Candidatus Cloacimonetes bacterium]|nr:T9SS type A sorting domain-containing protein [Candidatus Cloacimonadota bacterium]
GEVFVTDPFGPDEYGYYCYDDGDINYDLCPNYSWIEIDPNFGGSGTIIPLYDSGDMGDIEDIDLPFVFRFYGNNYTTITVCSNGWLTPGETETRSFMNWHIPGPLGPSPIIAPFWDDLKMSNGHVCYFYDELLHYFIVEWSHLQNDYDNSEETFQVILFDSNYYPTTTGNGEILFQYKTINNVNQGNYGTYSNHGQYATVGIEDHTGTVGLEYTYNNQYPTAAKQLEDEMTLLFTGSPIPTEGPFVIYDSYEIDDIQGNNNGIVNPGDTIAMPLTLRNVGVETAFNVTALLSTTDTFVNITDSLKSFCNIDSSETGTSLGDYIFDVTTICPDQHIIVFDLNITADGDYEWRSSFVVEVLSSDIATSTDTLDFEEIYIGYPESMTLTISNTGSDILNVIDIYSDNPIFTTDITLFNLSSGESQDVVVTVNTSFVGIISDTLFIISNDPDDPEVYISLLGLSVDLLPPDISVYPESISEELYPGEISQQELIIENNGITNLIIEIDCPDNLDAGMAVSFNEIDDYVSLGDHSSLHPNFPFSISVWVKIDSSRYNTIFANDTVGPNYYGFCIQIRPTNQVAIATGNGGLPGSSSRRSYVTDSGILLNVWYHIAVVAHSFSNRIIYINGFPANGSWSGSANTMVYNGDEARIGQSRNTSFCNGTIDDVRFWNYARSQLEIQSTMYSSLAGNETGLIGYWNFNSINPWDDLSGNGNNGNPHGNVIIVESTSPIIGWLSSNPVVCTIPPDSLVSIEITFNATILEIGNYEEEIMIYSNDPDTPEVVVPVSLNVLSTGIIDNIYPLITKLEGNYPNPFNPETVIKYQISNDYKIKLHIFNIKGQLVKTLINEIKEKGYHTAVWDGSDDNSKPVSSGIYLYKLQVGKSTFIKKMLLLK